jgi:hypothetical protein
VLFHVVGPESKSGLKISSGFLHTISDLLSLVRVPSSRCLQAGSTLHSLSEAGR